MSSSVPIRDYLRQDIGEVLFDTRESYEEALSFVRRSCRTTRARIKLYQETLSRCSIATRSKDRSKRHTSAK
jgi:Ribonuclease G/E